MKVTVHDLGLESLDTLGSVDSLLLFIPEDERPLRGLSGFADWRLCGALSRVLQQGFFRGDQNDKLLLPSAGKFPFVRIFAVGAGPAASASAQSVGELLSESARMLNRAGVEEVALELPGAGALDERGRASIFANRFVPSFKGRRVAVLGGKEVRAHLDAA